MKYILHIYMYIYKDGKIHIYVHIYMYVYKDGKIVHLIQQSEISPIIFLVISLSYLTHVFQLVERNFVDRIFELFLLSMLDAKIFPFLGSINRRMK